MTTTKLTGKLARWSLLLQENDFTVQHRKGVENTNADCLSRYPLPSDAGAPSMDWAKGEIMPVATFLAFMSHHVAAAGGGSTVAEEERDAAVLHFIQTHKRGSGQSAKERERVYRGARSYRWMGSSVFKEMPGGKMVVVPQVADREGIALETHRGMGHYGVQRVLDRLQQNYWWRGMGDTVVRIVKAYLSCARVKAGFRESGNELQPLPIRGMGYRWGVDVGFRVTSG